MYQLIKRLYGGRVSFNDPLLKPAFALLDLIDAAKRTFGGLRELPPYSIRVRTNGVQGEFGGLKFVQSAQRLLSRLPADLNLLPADVLDIGCSCGRLAYALRRAGHSGKYVGLDIDAKTIQWAQRNLEKIDPRYSFVLADVYSDVYNRSSATQAAAYQFPFQSGTFDVALAYSLFTHLLDDEVTNYFGNVSRCLKPRGTFVFSCFVMDGGASSSFLANATLKGNTYLYSEASPRKATAYSEDFLRNALTAAGFPDCRLIPGVWRTSNNLGGSDQGPFRLPEVIAATSRRLCSGLRPCRGSWQAGAV